MCGKRGSRLPVYIVKSKNTLLLTCVIICLPGICKCEQIVTKSIYNSYQEEFAVDQMLSQADQAAQSDWFGDYVRPYEHPKWEEAMRRTLGADQITAWDKAQAERKEAVGKETAEILKASVMRSSERTSQARIETRTPEQVRHQPAEGRRKLRHRRGHCRISRCGPAEEAWRTRRPSWLVSPDAHALRLVGRCASTPPLPALPGSRHDPCCAPAR